MCIGIVLRLEHRLYYHEIMTFSRLSIEPVESLFLDAVK